MPRPVDRPRWNPRPPEPSDHCGESRRREPDRSTPCAGIADEHIPGRLSFDLYLLRGNRQARAAYAAQCAPARRCDDDRTVESDADACRPHQGPVRPTYAAVRAPPCGCEASSDLTAAKQLLSIVLQRGSLLDVMA